MDKCLTMWWGRGYNKTNYKESGMSKKEAVEVGIGKLSDKPDEEFISTGYVELDSLIGGFARRRITEVWGKEGVGKSHLMAKCLAEVSKDHKVLYVDAEFALNKSRIEALGANPKNIDYVALAQLEKVAELLVREVNNYDLIILDSLAVLTPLTVETQEVGENAIGLFSRLIKHWVVKFRPRLAESHTAFVCVNQVRKGFGMFETDAPPGGKAWSHACDVRIQLSTKSADKIKGEDGKWVGHAVTAKVMKSRLTQPLGEVKFKVMY